MQSSLRLPKVRNWQCHFGDDAVPVTGDLSSFVRVSFFTNLLNTEEVNQQALRTAATATCFSVVNGRAMKFGWKMRRL